MKNILLKLLTAALLAVILSAATVNAASIRVIDDNDTVVLHGNVHPLARPEFDRGEADSSLSMQRVILTLRRSPEKEAELEKFLAALHDAASPNFHHWLSPQEFGNRFGPASADIDVLIKWLASHGLVVEEVAQGRMWVNFSGTVAQIEKAFHTRIHNYYVMGKPHHANSRDPEVPRGLADVVTGIVSLNDFPRKMMHYGARQLAPSGAIPDFTSGSSHYLAPGDFATIYNVNALYSAGIDGSGQSIAIVGRTHPSVTNWSTFRSMMGLPSNPPQVIVNGNDPGDLGADEDVEADLDVEWSGAVAKNATIKFVVSKSTPSTDGVDLSAQYIVNNNIAPVMNTSFGACEADLGTSGNNFYKNLWQQASAQGISSFVSTGDSGAAGCNLGSDSTGSGLGVNGLASTPYNIAVGGTQFSDGNGSYWNTSNGSGYTSVIGYIPEVTWNESGSVSGGSGLWSTGGGVSSKYTKPSWQAAPGVPSDGKRDLPDVSLSAASHDGYLVETQGALYSVGGTSASSPSFAGLMALIVQKTGQRQGNANARFYQLGNSQFGGSGASVFHDTTSGNNSVPGVTGYSANSGYDSATGLGSVDANALVNNWVPDFTISVSPASVSIHQVSAGTTDISTSLVGNFSNAITLSASGLPTGVTAAFGSNPIAAPGSGSSTMTLTVAAQSVPGTYTVNVTGAGGGTTHFAPLTLTIIQTFFSVSSSVNGSGGTISPGNASVNAGGSLTLTVLPDTGYHLVSITDNGVDVTSSVTNNSYTITNIAANHSVVAGFAINTYNITGSVGSGSGSVSPPGSTVNYGSTVTLTITPDSGYALSGLTDNGTAVTVNENPPGTFTYTITNVSADHNIVASFSVVAASPVPAIGPWELLFAAVCLIGYILKGDLLRRKLV